MNKILSYHQHIIKYILFLFCLFLLSWNLVRLAQTTPFSEDEVTHVEWSPFFDLYIKGDFQNEQWQSFDSYDMPKLADLTFGAFLTFHSKMTVQSYLEKTTFFSPGAYKAGDWRFEAKNATIFDDYLLHIQKAAKPIIIARLYTVLFFSIPTLVLIFYLNKAVMGWSFGLISMLLIGGNNLFAHSMSQAMCESSLFFFIFLTGCLLLKWLATIREKSSLWKMTTLVLAIGVTSGLATSAKLNGALSLVLVLCVCTSVYLRKKISFRLLFFSLLTIFAVSFSTFALTNPFIWSNPISKSLFMLHHRESVLEQQQQDPDTAASALTNLRDRVSTTYDRTLGAGGWYTNFGSKSHFITSDLIIFSWGLLLLKKKLEQSQDNPDPFTFWGIWLGVLLFTTLPIIPLDWDRYYLPVVIMIASVQALTIEKIWLLIKAKMI